MRRTWRVLVGEAISGIYPSLEAMTDAELRTVRNAPKMMSNINCWWLTYSLAPTIADIANNILRTRRMNRKRAKK